MIAKFAPKMANVSKVTEHSSVTATKVGLEMAFSAKMWMNAKIITTTVALMQTV